jgi:hypothetical protein
MMTKKIVKSRSKQCMISAPEEEKLEYERDFFKWTKTQAHLLKKRKLTQLDIDHLIKEIESLGKNDKRSLHSHTIILLMHLLKQKYQPEGQGNSYSWKSSMLNATRQIKLLLEDSPSLKKEFIKIYPKAYEQARQEAAIETQLDIEVFPEVCPWAIEEIFPFLKKKSLKFCH